MCRYFITPPPPSLLCVVLMIHKTGSLKSTACINKEREKEKGKKREKEARRTVATCGAVAHHPFRSTYLKVRWAARL
jgi:hypothetical protein